MKQEQDLHKAMADGRAEAYQFIREITQMLNSTNLTKAEKRESLDEFILETKNNHNDHFRCKFHALHGLRRLI